MAVGAAAVGFWWRDAGRAPAATTRTTTASSAEPSLDSGTDTQAAVAMYRYNIVKQVFTSFKGSVYNCTSVGGRGAAGTEVERRRREDRGAEGAEGVGVWGGGVPSTPG